MKKIWKVFATLTAVAMLGMGFIACSDNDDGGSEPTPVITITSSNYEAGNFYVNAEATLTATATNVSGTIKWSVDNDEVVELDTTVGTTVTVTALKAGTANITASIGTTNGTFRIVVDEDLASKVLDSLPWSVELPIMGSTGAISYSTSGNGHYNWGSMSGTATYAGLGFDGEFIYTDTSATKYDTNELVYKTETDSQTLKALVPKGERWRVEG